MIGRTTIYKGRSAEIVRIMGTWREQKDWKLDGLIVVLYVKSRQEFVRHVLVFEFDSEILVRE